MTRTFSKVYGLAALRVGWMYAPAEIIDALNRIRGPFNMNSAAISAGAAAIRDQAFIAGSGGLQSDVDREDDGRTRGLGLKVTPSVANFGLIHFPDVDGKRAPKPMSS